MWQLDYQESWALKNWCFWTVVWRRLLRVPWTARRSNQSILKEISPGCSLEGLMLKLKLQYLVTWCEELTHWKRPWCWEGLEAGREGDNRGWDGWMASLTRWTWVWVNSGSWWWTGRPGMLRFMASQRVRHDWTTELNWTDTYDASISNFLLPPSSSHSSMFSQSTNFGFPASYGKFQLAIYFTYGNVFIYVSMLLSQIIPPSPSSLCPKGFFFIFASPLPPGK